MSNRKTSHLFFSILLILILLQTIFLFNTGDIRLYSILFISSSLTYLIFIFLLNKYDVNQNQLFLIIVVLLLFKILFINIEPIGSDDYYRYIWDGKVHVNGINPYLFSPEDSTLRFLHSELLPEKVSYLEIKTIYFPVSQWLFATSYLISGENATGLKIFYLLFELLILISLFYFLKRFSIDKKYILIYAALPLITFQFFIDAHIDIVGAAFLIGSITLYYYNKKLLSYVLLGLSISVKPTGLLLIPFLFQNEKGLNNKLKAVFIPLVIFIITFLPYVFTATPIDTLINYSANWTFNGMVYNFINIFFANNLTIRLVCAILFLIVLFFIFISKMDLINKIYLSIFLLMIFSPVVHPWYLIWIAVFLPVVRSYSGIYFVAAVSLTSISIIGYQLNSVWQESTIVLLAEYIPLTLLFLYEIFRRRIRNELIV
jgi:alpha-1,6-mannosyltransferase